MRKFSITKWTKYSIFPQFLRIQEKGRRYEQSVINHSIERKWNAWIEGDSYEQNLKEENEVGWSFSYYSSRERNPLRKANWYFKGQRGNQWKRGEPYQKRRGSTLSNCQGQRQYHSLVRK
jgi:hypothetical protein